MEMSAVDRVSGASFGIDSGKATGGRAAGASFGEMFGNILASSEAKQADAMKISESLASGEPQDLHRVMNSLNEADLSFRLVLEVRNKLVEAWQEIKRMPI